MKITLDMYYGIHYLCCIKSLEIMKTSLTINEKINAKSHEPRLFRGTGYKASTLSRFYGHVLSNASIRNDVIETLGSSTWGEPSNRELDATIKHLEPRYIFE